MKDGEIVIYIGNINDNNLIGNIVDTDLIYNKQYKVRFAKELMYYIKLTNYKYLCCDYEFLNKNFISLKQFRKQKLQKIYEK